MNETKYIHPAVPARAALRKEFGAANVTCTRGSGTGYGWVTAKVFIDRPAYCTCAQDSPSDVGSHWGRCSVCTIAKKDAETRMYAALKGIKFGSYYSDDYADSRPYDEFLHDIWFKTPSASNA